VLCHARPCAPAPIECLGEPEDYLSAVFHELDRDAPARDAVAPRARSVLDRRGESPLAVLSDAIAAGGEVLAVCADVARRIDGLSGRVGGFALISYPALEREPSILDAFQHLVVLDPPSSAVAAQVIRGGSGITHLAWGPAELRFAEQMHELEYGLRTSLVTLYRELRLLQRVVGEELERLLRGGGPHARPARLAGRLVRVLAELELVSLDRDLPALAIASDAHTELDRSPAYRVYTQRYEDGRRYLSSANPRPSG
jgi:single-stranded-DNA-specific exonuclease